MKLLRTLIRISMMIAMAFGIFRDDILKAIWFAAMFIFCMYGWPAVVIFIAKKCGLKYNSLGYGGEIAIKPPEGEEQGHMTFKLYSEPESLLNKDEVSLLIKHE